MSETKKKKKEDKILLSPNPNAPLGQLLLDCTHDKYRMVSMATRWALEIKNREPGSTHSPQDLVDMAMREILTGEALIEDIEKLPPPPKPEKKSPELSPKALAEKAMSLKSGDDEKGDDLKGVEKE